MKSLTDDLPKALVKVNGTPFIINQLDALAIHKEIDEVFIIVGYRQETLKALHK